MTVYAQTVGGVIVAVFANPQPGTDGLQGMADDDPSVTAFRASLLPRAVLTFNQLLNRFTSPELSALALAAQSNPQILLWMTMGAGAAIDVTDPQVAAGMDALVGAGVITSARKSEILTQ